MLAGSGGQDERASPPEPRPAFKNKVAMPLLNTSQSLRAERDGAEPPIQASDQRQLIVARQPTAGMRFKNDRHVQSRHVRTKGGSPFRHCGCVIGDD
jgi:hypothetical protein